VCNKSFRLKCLGITFTHAQYWVCIYVILVIMQLVMKVVWKNINTFMVVILHIPEMCVIMCSCLYAKSRRENTLMGLGEFGQGIILSSEWRRLHIKILLIFVFILWSDDWIKDAELNWIMKTNVPIWRYRYSWKLYCNGCLNYTVWSDNLLTVTLY
jgi:hypothetical protein